MELTSEIKGVDAGYEDNMFFGLIGLTKLEPGYATRWTRPFGRVKH
jgi:hypothetical protein